MEAAIKRLNHLKHHIPFNTYRTIKGQIKSGNLNAALIGIERLEKKLTK